MIPEFQQSECADFLTRTAEYHRSRSLRSLCLLVGVSCAGLGTGLVIYGVHGAIMGGTPLRWEHLVFCVVGVLGIVAGWLLRFWLLIARVAHEALGIRGHHTDSLGRGGRGGTVDEGKS